MHGDNILDIKRNLPDLEITPIQGEFLKLLPYRPTRTREKGLEEIVYTDKWGKVVIYGRETMNAFDLKVFVAFSYLLWKKIQAGDIYDAGETIHELKEQGNTRREVTKLVGITTTMSSFLKCMRITHSKSNADLVWESLLRYVDTTWVFYLKRKDGGMDKILSKIIHDIRQSGNGLSVIVSERYKNTIKRMSGVLGVTNRIIQSIKNDTAVLLSCWLQGKQPVGTFYLVTIAEAVRIPKDRKTTERIKKAFDELKRQGQVDKYEIIREGKRSDNWKVYYEQNKKLLSIIKSEMYAAKKALKKN